MKLTEILPKLSFKKAILSLQNNKAKRTRSRERLKKMEFSKIITINKSLNKV